MLVGVLQVDLHIPESGSLKSKRFIVSSLKSRLRNKFNVSVAEVDGNDKWQRTTLGIAMVSNQQRFLERAKSQILNYIEVQSQIEMLECQFDIL
jgi:uncharacterized protein YlxP (DUF503 family)